MRQTKTEIDTNGLRIKVQTDFPSKVMTITMPDRHTPQYDIKGEWAGKDIMVIVRTLGRAYRLLQRTRRRELGIEDTSDNGQQPISAKGALNG